MSKQEIDHTCIFIIGLFFSEVMRFSAKNLTELDTACIKSSQQIFHLVSKECTLQVALRKPLNTGARSLKKDKTLPWYSVIQEGFCSRIIAAV
jgi:hypothetical protein